MGGYLKAKESMDLPGNEDSSLWVIIRYYAIFVSSLLSAIWSTMEDK